MPSLVLGILAHVDAGKTTLAEAILVEAGRLKKAGRVDHGDTLLDSHALERERGITIFASQATFSLGDLHVTLLDTPGHVDFSAETERTLSVLDYAILVISGSDGVQAHTMTLWKLLAHYHVPTLLFVTKMDLARRTQSSLLSELQSALSPQVVDFCCERAVRDEALAMCSEPLLERYLTSGRVENGEIQTLIRTRAAFPCWFGSGLRGEGVGAFLAELSKVLTGAEYPEAFGARVFKITHDAQAGRLTHLKVTGGTLHVRDTVFYDGRSEKAVQLRVYNGAKFAAAEQMEAGGVCAVAGLTETRAGQGLGFEAQAAPPLLEPVMRYRILTPREVDPRVLLAKLKQLEEEDPQLRFAWDSRTQTLHVELMGAVQTEILKRLIAERFGAEVEISQGTVLYRETIAAAVEGVGHYEPLRHYAEVHLLLEPLARGSGLVFAADCSEDKLDRNWQRLILTHLAEKQHLGVLTGSPITDMKITLKAGCAHQKHTEGGDFRQATYRAVRQGLMGAESVLLEPYDSFRLELPPELIGRAITDIRARHGSFDAPEPSGDMTLLRGKCPVSTLGDYAQELASYSRGRGRLLRTPAGFDLCHNPEEVVAQLGYDAESDLENPPDSVFCAHGGGFTVKWREVQSYMHLASILQKPQAAEIERRRSFRIDEQELAAIMEREFGKPKHPLVYRKAETASKQTPETIPEQSKQPPHLIVDGYNVIFAWDELRAQAETDLDGARERLMELLQSYTTFTGCRTVLVFDAYRVPGGQGERFDRGQMHVAFTRERETADAYIERLVHEIGKNERVQVVTSDGLIQLSALRSGVLRMSAREFAAELDAAFQRMDALLKELHGQKLGTVGENIEQRRTVPGAHPG